MNAAIRLASLASRHTHPARMASRQLSQVSPSFQSFRAFSSDGQKASASASPTTPSSPSTSSADQVEAFSPYEFPDRSEAPIITRSSASDIDKPVKEPNAQSTQSAQSDQSGPSTPTYTISPDRKILPTPPLTLSSASSNSSNSFNSSNPQQAPTSTTTTTSATSDVKDELKIPTCQITTLPNGVRVGSMEMHGSVVSSLGVFLDFGSRHELDSVPGVMGLNGKPISTSGVNHLLELLAFQSTKSHTSQQIKSIFEHLGAATFANSSREQMMYCVDVLNTSMNASSSSNVEQAFSLLSETIRAPVLEEGEVDEMKRVMEFQWMDVMPQVWVGEGLQRAGYGKLNGEVQQLGRPHFCTPDALPNLTAQSVHTFREQNLLHRPEGIVVAGSGIAHDVLVELAEKNFGDVKGSEGGSNASSSNSTLITNPNSIPSTYTGGEYRHPITTPNLNPAKPEYTHVALAFEVGGWHSSDLVPICVLQTLLGGGSSFSAGGPGKGMYSRLYREVLNKYMWAESAESFSSFHSESGLWGMSGSCPADKGRELTRVLVEHFGKLRVDLVSDEELDRARNMLKCNVLTQLESRLVLLEDIGRQILTYGKREDAESMCAKIDAVTKEDIREIVQKAVAKKPTLVTVGRDVGSVPRVEEVEGWLGQGPVKKSWF